MYKLCELFGITLRSSVYSDIAYFSIFSDISWSDWGNCHEVVKWLPWQRIYSTLRQDHKGNPKEVTKKRLKPDEVIWARNELVVVSK